MADTMIMYVVEGQADTSAPTETPWQAQLRHYQDQKARTDAVWAGIHDRQRFVLQHRSSAPCVPCRWWEGKRDDLEMG